MRSSVLGAIYGALVADAFCLGGQWVYETDAIREKFPQLEDFYDPLSEYHGKKKSGDFTHYGDQCMWLLESLSLEHEFSISSYCERWKEYISSYKGYIDGASETSLKNLNSGKSILEAGSTSQDFGVIGRMAPLALVYYANEKEFEDAAVLHTKMTHNVPELIDLTRFFSGLLHLVFEGDRPKDAILKILEYTYNEKIKSWIKIALASTRYDTIEAIKSFGQSSNLKACFPGVLHLILKYEDDYAEAMRQNVYAGGDCASRAMAAGMILGAYNGFDKIPKKWRESLSSKDRISDYLGVAYENE